MWTAKYRERRIDKKSGFDTVSLWRWLMVAVGEVYPLASGKRVGYVASKMIGEVGGEYFSTEAIARNFGAYSKKQIHCDCSDHESALIYVYYDALGKAYSWYTVICKTHHAVIQPRPATEDDEEFHLIECVNITGDYELSAQKLSPGQLLHLRLNGGKPMRAFFVEREAHGLGFTVKIPSGQRRTLLWKDKIVKECWSLSF